MLAPAPALAADRFALILNGMYRAVAGPAGRCLIAGTLVILICARLRRQIVRFVTLAAHVQAGTLPASRHRTTPSLRARRKPGEAISGRTPPPAASKDRLPTRFAWLLRLMPEAGCFRSQFAHFLWDPEVLALLEAAPQVGRILRGLCRMLGIKLKPGAVPPALILPRRPRRKRTTPPLPPPEGEGRGEGGAQCAGPAPGKAALPESDADLVEYILRWADTQPATSQAAIGRVLPE